MHKIAKAVILLTCGFLVFVLLRAIPQIRVRLGALRALEENVCSCDISYSVSKREYLVLQRAIYIKLDELSLRRWELRQKAERLFYLFPDGSASLGEAISPVVDEIRLIERKIFSIVSSARTLGFNTDLGTPEAREALYGSGRT